MHLHIDDFSQDVARILLQLYMNFPRPQAVYVEDISGPDQLDEAGLHGKRHMACLGAMLWLAEEGFLRYQSTLYQEGIEQAVLSNRAFTLLTATDDTDPGSDPALPISVQLERATLAERFRAALAARDSTRIAALVRHFLARATP
jgi:hypothetical protein|tara:strand:+ start:357 stop:791 length:435 start_codon:yes stop_codon:yes gene_type:complete